MKLRLPGLADIDPLAVPLPNGTEVTTRVDRQVGDHAVSQGAIGRVVGAEGGVFDVHIVGVGVVRYMREEIAPRKLGQLRFARRRQSAWQSLRSCVLLQAVVGSRAWGLADASSDTDIRGFFALPFSWTSGLPEAPRDLVSEDGSATFWEVGKGFRQAIGADPNTLEALFVDEIEVHDPMGQWILDARDAFVSIEIYGSFGRYALSQLKRLAQSKRLAEHRSLILRQLAENPSLTLDEVAVWLARESQIVAPTEHDATNRAKDYIKQLYRSMYDQGILATREFAALVAHAQSQDRAALAVPRELRPKNAYNLIRLIDTAIQWLRCGQPAMRVRDELRATLLDIKNGRMPLAQVLELAHRMTPELERARGESKLPSHADVGTIDALLRRIREELARRHIHAEPGPFGADAAPCPLAEWRA